MRFVRGFACAFLVGLVFLAAAGTANAQLITVNPPVLSFVYQLGGPNPPAQSLFLSSASPLDFTVSLTAAPWLTIVPPNGTTPSTLTASVLPPLGVTPGTFTGTISIVPNLLGSIPTVIPVSFQVLSPQPESVIYVSPDNLTFDYRIGGPLPSPAALSLTSSPGQAAFTLSTSTTSGGAWLAISPTNGVTPSTAIAIATPYAGMGPGIYTGTITVIPSSGGGIIRNIPVTLRISSVGSLSVTPAYLSYNYQTGGALPSPQVLSVVDSLGGATPFTVTATTTSGGPWLFVSSSSGTTPASVIVNVSPAALTPGTYYGTVSFSPVGGTTSAAIPVTLAVLNNARLLASPTSLLFNYQIGGPSVPTQYISVTSSGSPITFNAGVQGPSWITLTTSGALTTPTGVGVVVRPPSSTPQGAYSATVTLSPASGGSIVSVPVSVQVLAANYLSVGRKSVTFNAATGGQILLENVSVTSSNGPVQYQAVTSGLWLGVAQSDPNTPSNIQISANPSGLKAGTYQGQITLFSDEVVNSPQIINVTLSVSTEPVPAASPYGLMFSYQVGGPDPPVETTVISSTGVSQSFTATASTDTGKWLIIGAGTTTPGTVAAAVNIDGLTPGVYTGSILVQVDGASVPPLQLPVMLSVTAGPAFRVNTNLMAFQYRNGGSAPAPQTLSVGVTTGALSFTPMVLTADGGSWLAVTPEFATAPADVTVSVNPSGLAAGSYFGLIAFSSVGGEDQTYYVPVSLQVSDDPILTVPSQSLIFTATAGGPISAAQKIKVRGTGTSSPFQVTANEGWLHVSPGSGTTDVDLSVQASPASLTAGYYFGVVQIEIPGVQNSQQYVPVVFVVNSPAAAAVGPDR